MRRMKGSTLPVRPVVLVWIVADGLQLLVLAWRRLCLVVDSFAVFGRLEFGGVEVE